ncbi:MAG: carboxypeptidase regulatory-like domain-containing protein [Planctomycetes bacterium]|nr:carboxypeptidase regulatory-like domain-containing protein [Planctomycetota bacterium]
MLAVVGVLLPLLFWMIGDPGDLDPANRKPSDFASARAAIQPEGVLPAPLPGPGPSRTVSKPAEAVEPEPARVRVGPPPPWGNDSVWRGTPAPPINGVAAVYTATFTGRVVNAAGRPVPNTKVAGGVASGGCWGGPTSVTTGDAVRTDAEGRFRLTVGTYTHHVALGPPGETDLIPRDHPLPRVGHGDTVDLGDLPLHQGGRIEGHVRGARGGPLAGVQVRLDEKGLGAATHSFLDVGMSSNFGSGSIVYLQEGKTISLDQLSSLGGRSLQLQTWGGGASGPSTNSRADGSYTLHAVPQGSYTLVAIQGQSAVARRDGVTIRPHEVRAGVDFRLAPGPRLEVEVYDGRGVPIRGATVTANDNEGFQQVLETNAQGVATSLQPFAGREFNLSVTKANMRVQTSSIQAPEGAELFRVRVTLLAAAQLSGRTDPGGVYLHDREAAGVYSAASRGQDGSFTFADVIPGRYDVLLSAGGRWLVLAKDVMVRAGQPVDLGDLTPVPLAPLRVTVLDKRGSPVESAVVHCPDAPGLPSQITNAAGLCELLLPPGRYAYTVTTLRGVQVQVELGGGEVETVRIPAGKYSLRIKSTAEGTPLRTLTVRQGSRQIVTLQFEGEKLLELAEAGRYEVAVDGHDFGSVEVSDEALATIEVGAPRAVSVRLQILGARGQPLPGVDLTVSALDPRPSQLEALAGGFGQNVAGKSNAEGRLASQIYLGPSARAVFVSVVVEGQSSVFRLPVGAGGELSATLRLKAERRGRVDVDAAGLGAPGALVELKPLSALAAANQIATLDANGRAVFAGVRPGTYRVTLLGQASASVEVEVSAAGARAVLTGA